MGRCGCAERESSGVVVRLFWNEDAGARESEIVVEYQDRTADVLITILPTAGPRPGRLLPPHPNAYRDCTRSWTRFWVRV